jgi:hypothetical protein
VQWIFETLLKDYAMGYNFLSCNRNQSYLLPPSLTDWLPEGHLAWRWLIAFVVWAIAIWLWRYVSLASLLAAVLFPVILTVLICLIPDWRFGNLWPLYIAATGIPLLVIARHAENIKRLLEGSEPKVGAK